uniref:hypothetical protein n=1 Tax=Nocardia sp. CA-095871 TaxID=3239971 RepID=UPI003F491023
MRTPDYAFGPNDTPPPEIEDADILAAILGDEPVVVLLPRFAISHIAQDGQLVSADALESAMQARGAEPLTDLEFANEPIRGWRALLNIPAAHLRITTPDDIAIYTGSLDCNDQWHRLLAENVRHGRGLVLITCSAATAETAVELINAGRANWIRVPVTLA